MSSLRDLRGSGYIVPRVETRGYWCTVVFGYYAVANGCRRSATCGAVATSGLKPEAAVAPRLHGGVRLLRGGKWVSSLRDLRGSGYIVPRVKTRGY